VSLLPVHLITAAELLIVAWLTDGLVQGGSALGLVASVLIQGVAFAATWFSLMAICLRTNAEARADANMFIGLLRYGLKRLRSGRLRSGGAT
jgi:hypothetical protein